MKGCLRKRRCWVLILVLVIILETVGNQEKKTEAANYKVISGKQLIVSGLEGLSPSGKKSCFMNFLQLAGKQAYCLEIDVASVSGNYTAKEVGYGEYKRYLKGAIYYAQEKDGWYQEEDQITRYKASQLLIWRLMQMQQKGEKISEGIYNQTLKKYLNSYCSKKAAGDIQNLIAYSKENEYRDSVTLTTYVNKNSQDVLAGQSNHMYCQAKLRKNVSYVNEEADRKAVYGIYLESGKEITRITTDTNSGVGSSKKALDCHTRYYAKEIQEPSGALISNKKYYFTTGESGSVTNVLGGGVEDQPDALEVAVIKEDKDHPDQLLSGAEFTIYEFSRSKTESQNQAVFCEIKESHSSLKKAKMVTDANGIARSGLLYRTKDNEGIFKIVESKAPDGYKLGDFERVISTEHNNVITLTYTVKNEKILEYGEVGVKKRAVNTQGKELPFDLTGVTYTLYEKKKDGSVGPMVGQIITDQNGEGCLDHVLVGDYYVEESRAIEGLERKEGFSDLRVEKNQRAWIDSEFSKDVAWHGSIGVHKVNEGDFEEGIPETVFEVQELIASKGSYEKVASFKTDENGYGRSPELTYTRENLGRFRLVESEANKNFIKDENWCYEFCLTGKEETLTVEVANKKRTGSLELQKYALGMNGKEEKDCFEGVVYRLYKSYALEGGQVVFKKESNVGAIKLDSFGRARVDQLDVGDYLLVEEEGDVSSWLPEKLKHQAKRSMKLSIYDGKTTYCDGRKGISYDGENYETAYCATGDAIDLKKEDYRTNVLLNRQKSIQVDVVKEDLKGRKLAGTKFLLEAWNQKQGEYEVLYQECFTNEDGQVKDPFGNDLWLVANSNNLGRFRIRESQPSPGYLNSGYYKEISFEEGESQEGTFRFYDKVVNSPKEYDIFLDKTDQKTGVFVSGAEFKLYDEEGKTEYGTFLEEDGVYHLKVTNDILQGHLSGYFLIKEDKVPKGYVTYKEEEKNPSLKIELTTDDDILKVELENRPVEGEIRGHKRDADREDGSPCGDLSLKGAVYGVFTNNGKDLVAKTVSDVNGDFVFEGLELENYQVMELEAPKGYQKSPEVFEAPLKDLYDQGEKKDVEIVSLEHEFLEKPERGKLCFRKYGSGLYGGREKEETLSGAVFGIYLLSDLKKMDPKIENHLGSFTYEKEGVYKDNSCSGTFTTDDLGYGKLEQIPKGTYVLVELEEPEGYERIDPIIFEMKNSSGDMLVELGKLVDQRKTLPIRLIKKDARTGKVIAKEGTSFKIKDQRNGEYLCDSEGRQVFTTGEDGSYVLSEIPLGNYLLEEVKAPDGYLLADPMNIRVDLLDYKIFKDKGQEKQIFLYDQATKVKIYKYEEGSKKELGGAIFDLLDEKGNVVKKIKSQKGGTLIYGLIPGKYQLVEVKAPKGYLKAKNVDFEVKEVKNLQIVTVTDAKISRSFSSRKNSGSRTKSTGTSAPKTGDISPTKELIMGMISLFVLLGILFFSKEKKRKKMDFVVKK